jgi:thiamine-phosphate pyrophosphorylase
MHSGCDCDQLFWDLPPSITNPRPTTLTLPRLYAIVDASCFSSAAALFDYTRCLLESGVRFIQYRNKTGTRRDMLSHAREMRRIAALYTSTEGHSAGAEAPNITEPYSTAGAVPLPALGSPILVMNDYADLALAAGFDGVHVGQDDLSVEAVRSVGGPQMIVGISTHNPEQVAEADRLAVTYIAVGPVFATSSKANPDPVIGVDGLRRARELTSKPLVAIGGITRANAGSVIEAGADSVAVISDLLSSPAAACEEFRKVLG